MIILIETVSEGGREELSPVIKQLIQIGKREEAG